MERKERKTMELTIQSCMYTSPLFTVRIRLRQMGFAWLINQMRIYSITLISVYHLACMVNHESTHISSIHSFIQARITYLDTSVCTVPGFISSTLVERERAAMREHGTRR